MNAVDTSDAFQLYLFKLLILTMARLRKTLSPLSSNYQYSQLSCWKFCGWEVSKARMELHVFSPRFKVCEFKTKKQNTVGQHCILNISKVKSDISFSGE